MFEIKLTDFRCFADALPVEVRPITFLVGENSAGKTSFLAATRFLLESLSRSLQNPFNREPYQLGGFDQLAHYRGGPRGRANQFSIEMKIEGKSGANHSRSIGPASYRFVFVKGSPQPKLSEYVVTFDDITVKLDLGNKVSISFQRKGQEPISVDQGRLTSMSIIKDEFFYIRYLYEMLTFHFKSSKIKQDNDIKQIIELALTNPLI